MSTSFAGNAYSYNHNISTTGWVDVAVRYDVSGGTKYVGFIVDGVEVSSQTPAAAMGANFNQFYIG